MAPLFRLIPVASVTAALLHAGPGLSVPQAPAPVRRLPLSALPPPPEFVRTAPIGEDDFGLAVRPQTTGCREVYAVYDSAIGFPSRCLIDRRAGLDLPDAPAQADDFRISDFTILSASP